MIKYSDYRFTTLERTFAMVPAAIQFTTASTTPLTPTNATRNTQIESVGSDQEVMVDKKVSLCQKNTIMQSMKKNVFKRAVDKDPMK